MGIKGAKTIAEYAMKRWAVEQGFVMEHFTLTVSGNNGKLEDRHGDSIMLVYDRETKTVHVEGE